jgi:hypothetical protein
MLRLCTILLAATSVLSGCASEFQVDRATPLPERISLPPHSAVYIPLPKDGTFEFKPYPGSGSSAAAAAAKAFSRHAERVEVGTTVQTAAEGLASARSGGFTHCAALELVHWEDRATEWSGKRDRATIAITLSDARTASPLDKATITATGTWWTLGGLHPQDLLERMMTQYEQSTLAPAK